MDSMTTDLQGHILQGSLGNLSSDGVERSGVSSPSNPQGIIDQAYLEGLLREREALLVGAGMDLTKRLINQEIERIQNGGKTVKTDDKKMNDVTKDKSIKLTVKVLVPVKDHPKFNFVGKLLGPKGNSLKRLQEETMTKMAILGRGSIRDKQKEEELRLSGDQKFNHLSEDLHVEVAALAPPAEAHARIAYALTEIRRYLVPDYNDEIRQEQMREMQMMNNNSSGNNANMNTEPSANNGNLSASEEGSSSPHSNGGENIHQSPPHGERRSQKDKEGTAKSRTNSQGRRSVLSLLTKARAIQQKEHEFMGVFHDMPSSYNVYEHLSDPVTDNTSEELSGRTGSSLKVTATPNDRTRFRHDPYPRVASST